MLDSQKLTFQEFMLGLKHGVYVFVQDSCEICHKYQKSIEYINSPFLYFVDVVTQLDRDTVYKLTQRAAFPQTAVFWENQLDYVRMGQLFDLQLEEIHESLKKFGNKPLSFQEQQERLKIINSRCELSYYIFPPDTDQQIRNKIINMGIKYNEMPLDVEYMFQNIPDNDRFHMLEGNMPFTKLVVFRQENTNIYSPFAQRILVGYTSRVKNQKLIIRNLQEELNATDNPSLNQET